MDIAIPQNSRAKTTRRLLLAAVALLLVTAISYGLTRLRPAAPSVDGASLFSDTVKRGDVLRAVHGTGLSEAPGSARVFDCDVSPGAARRDRVGPHQRRLFQV